MQKWGQRWIAKLKIRQNLSHYFPVSSTDKVLPKASTPMVWLVESSERGVGGRQKQTFSLEFEAHLQLQYWQFHVHVYRTYTRTYLQVRCLIVPNSLKIVPEIFNFERNPNQLPLFQSRNYTYISVYIDALIGMNSKTLYNFATKQCNM